MDALERPQFETEADKHIYQYVERHGTAARHAVRNEVALPLEEFRERLQRLKSRGYIEEDGGTLRLALDLGAVEEYATDSQRYTIRPGTHSDFEGLVDAIRAVTAEETYVVAETVAEELLYDDTVTRHNTVESRMFFVATADDELVGWTHLDLPQVEKLRDTARQTVGVREPYRENGIGSRLLRRGIDWAEANGYRKVYNSVPATNEEAMVFLEDHGWHTEGIRKNHYTIGDRHVDEVNMAYTLDNSTD
ncbi:MAG: N-acetyltransferase family protein [Haloarculaceae archaeon]